MSDFQAWQAQIEQLLEELAEIDFGYPLGSNELRPARSPDHIQQTLAACGINQHADLFHFYNVCNGLSWPDVHNGYFVDSIESLAAAHSKSYAVNRIRGEEDFEVAPIGSMGGGELFVLRKDNGNLLLLPPGSIVDRIYDNTDAQATTVAPTFTAFTKRLLEDLEAFVHDTDEYSYLSAI